MNEYPAFAIASCRPAGLFALLESIMSAGYGHWPIRVCAQRFTPTEISTLFAHPMNIQAVFHRDLLGPYRARLAILKEWRHPVWCNLDDDAVLMPGRTNYGEAVAGVLENPWAGLVSCNWARTAAVADRKVLTPKFVKQAVVYTGGGLVYRDDVGDAIRRWPEADYLFDNVEWSLAAYLSGYVNYRFLGSVALASACTREGRREWTRLKGRAKPDPQFVVTEKAKSKVDGMGNDYHIPASGGLTEAAHSVHRAAYSLRWGK